MSIAVVDSGGANIASILHALRRLGTEPVFTADDEVIRAADKVILPGVGAAAAAMSRLRKNNLVSTLRELQQPVLGICLGMQLLFESTDEGDTDLLAMIPARVRRIPQAADTRVPHMGWNQIRSEANDCLVNGVDQDWFYFVHSYAAPTGPWSLGDSEHGRPFCAVARRDNFRGVQFHPERSGAAGSRLLRNFLDSAD